ncbi:type IV pilus modification protein PilV [Paraneptunicella aestuarii]|nr:type IV pilus modification protein PilV [Paraneptunicella aestuarii]
MMSYRLYEVRNKQSGIGMIEVLVTLVILSIGLLGVASLQFIGTFANADALSRSQAVMVAQQMSERLRANAVLSAASNGMVVDNGYFDDSIYNFENLSCGSSASNFVCHCLSHPPSIPDCRNNQCTAAQFAIFDAYEVSCSVASANPNIRIDVNCADNNILDADTCSAGSIHSIILKWPVQNWQNIERVLNPECNEGELSPHDCVVLDVTL